ncbi:amino acid permease [bacterium]|nr:amino acid permease [bacterium]
MTDSARGIYMTRRLGIFTATAIVVANMIGTGIFTTSGIMASMLPGPGWVIVCWLAGGLIAVSGALCYAELATRMPEEGGEYFYLNRLYHPVLGFLTGWTSFIVGFSAPIAASAMACSAYIYAGLHTGDMPGGDTQIDLVKKVTAAAIIVVFTLVHYLGHRPGSIVQNFLTVLKITIISGLALAGVVLGGGSLSNLSHQAGGGSGGMAVGTAMMLVMFAYSGWNASAYIAGEIKEPRKTLPVSLILGTVIVIILYLAVNIFIFYAVPYNEMQGVITVVEHAAVRAFGEWMGDVLSILIGIALLSSLSAFILIGPRVYFAMARDGLFFRFASRVHPRYGVPGTSILIQGLLAVIMVMIGTFEQLLVYLGFALSIFPWLAVAGVFIARKKHIGDGMAVKVRGYPVVPVFYLASSLGLMVVAYINRPFESSVAIATVLLGLPCYYLWIKGLRGLKS